MKLASFDAIAAALQEAGVRYLIAGGMAVNAHGYVRYTQDVDIVIQLHPDNIVKAFSALATLGYRPAVPILAEEFAKEDRRRHWIASKGMTVLNFWSDAHRDTPVDVFVTDPFEFDAEYRMGRLVELTPGVEVRFVSLATLIRMKEAVGRMRDLDDVQHLRWIVEDSAGSGQKA